MCQRITRQSNAAKAGGRRGKRDAIETIETIETSQDLNQEDVLEEDEIEIREGRNYHHHREQLDKQLASQLRMKVMIENEKDDHPVEDHPVNNDAELFDGDLLNEGEGAGNDYDDCDDGRAGSQSSAISR